MGAGNPRGLRIRSQATLGGGEELDEQTQLFRRQVKEDTDRIRHNTNRGVFAYGTTASGHIRFTGQPAAGDTVTVQLFLIRLEDGSDHRTVTVVFVFEDTVADQITVALGADAAATALNLATAIAAAFTGLLAAEADGSSVDMFCERSGDRLMLSATGSTLVAQNNANQVRGDITHTYTLERTVTDEDVEREKIVVDTDFASLLWLDLKFLTSDMNWADARVTDPITVSAGKITVDRGGLSPYDVPYETGMVLKIVGYGVPS